MKLTPPDTNLDEDREKAYRGNLSAGAISRLKKSFENLMEISDWKSVKVFKDIKRPNGDMVKKPYQLKFRINFITLTLSAPQGAVTDRQIYNICFKPFLDAMRYRCPDVSYVWKAEVQRNGNIHFHITTNQYFDYRWVRSNWNKHQAKLGFIKSFAEKHGHTDPNSTDIKTVRQDGDLGAYMAKYICKKEAKKRTLGIKVWDCSSNLKFKEIRNLPICNEVNEWIDSLKRSEKVQVFRTEQAIILQSPTDWVISELPESIRELHKQYIGLLKDCTGHSQRLYLEDMKQKQTKANILSRSREPVRPNSSRLTAKQLSEIQPTFDFYHYDKWSSYVKS
jgi:hypothetical protein